jgi:hypothetical protein
VHDALNLLASCFTDASYIKDGERFNVMQNDKDQVWKRYVDG